MNWLNLRFTVLALAVCAASPAPAAVYRIGSASGCTRATIRAAVHVATLLLIGLITTSGSALAQLPDQGYNPNANALVRAIAVQPDGRAIVAGDFTNIAGTARQRITRLRVDGTNDPTFAALVINGSINALAIQPDGKIMIGGEFTLIGTSGREHIARLNADGTLDPSFGFGSGTNNTVTALALQPDGKVLLGGLFTSYNGVLRNNIARSNADGSVDLSFDPGTGPDSFVGALALQPDGKVLLGGGFDNYNGTARRRIARIYANGSLDTGFDPGTGASSAVTQLALLPDGKLLLGGAFTNYNGMTRNRIARINSDGSLDISFTPGTGADDQVSAFSLQADGKVLLGGRFTTYNGTARNFIARINANGSLDASFNPVSGASHSVSSLALQPDGKVLLGGLFTSYNGVARNYVARIDGNAGLDVGFPAGTPSANNSVYALALQPDSKLVLGGSFTSYNGTMRNAIARIHADGSLDSSFNPGSGANSTVFALALQPDGKLLLGGSFTNYNGMSRNRIARINADGSLDSSFNPGIGPDNAVFALALQPDGRILVAGSFTLYAGASRNRVARLNVDGTLDTSFDPGLGANGYVAALALQPDGKVLLGGDFTGYNGTPRSKVVRINANGSLDSSFDPGLGASSTVFALALQPDGKLLVGGDFASYNNTPVNYMARVNANGSLDTSFVSGGGANGAVAALALQADGKLLVGGVFTTAGAGFPRNRIARFNADGTLDLGFTPGSGANGYVAALAPQSDGKVLLGGEFTAVNGLAFNRIARLGTQEAAISTLSHDGFAVRWLRSGSGPELAQAPQLLFSTSGIPVTFTSLGTMTRIAGGWEMNVPTLPVGTFAFVQARGVTSSGQYNGSSGLIEQITRVYVSDRIFYDGFQ